jgi:hypothetical protein
MLCTLSDISRTVTDNSNPQPGSVSIPHPVPVVLTSLAMLGSSTNVPIGHVEKMQGITYRDHPHSGMQAKKWRRTWHRHFQ